MSILSVKNVSVGYEGKEVIQNISFDIEKGSYLCIVGENGSGKSTLMKTILGLIQPIKGEIVFGDGVQKNEIGYLPQQTVVQRDFPASVKEIVLSGFQGSMGMRPFYTKEEKKIANINMDKMNISNLSKCCYRELSGGQQQRVLLARALCATQKLILLDEPVTGLDPKAMLELYELIQKLNNEGVTIIMISHDISVAIKYASHILHIDNQVFFGTKQDYISNDISSKFLAINKKEEF